jgi:hypothetical protein
MTDLYGTVAAHIKCVRNAHPYIMNHDQWLHRYINLIKHQDYHLVNGTHAFSQGQLLSKAWLCDTIASQELSLGNIWLLAGWIGTLGYMLLERRELFGIDKIRSFDIDPVCADLAETYNKDSLIDDWRFKALTMDVNHISYDDFVWRGNRPDGTFSEPRSESADTVINTSCDHMGGDDSWWRNIPSGKLVILQNNNWHENIQHDNSVDTVDEFQLMYPMKELLFSGEFDCKLYRRFMLIGRK